MLFVLAGLCGIIVLGDINAFGRPADTFPRLSNYANVKFPWNSHSHAAYQTQLNDDEENRPFFESTDLYEQEPSTSDYLEEQVHVKRSPPVSPYISLEAFNNLSNFFEQLKESFEAIERRKAEEARVAAVAAVENERSFRPATTAAVLHAFRHYKPLRRTRSYPPALLQG